MEKVKESYLDKDLIIYDRYKILNYIGGGFAGETYLVQDIKENKKYFLKTVFKTTNRYVSFYKEYFEYLKNIKDILEKTDNKTIIVPTKMFDDDKFFYELYRFISDVRSLDSIILDKEKLKPSYVLEIIQKILKALIFLHSKKIIHGDIKPSNILITADKSIYITDAGFIKWDKAQNSFLIVGTYLYAHPVLRESISKNNVSSSKNADIGWKTNVIGPFLDIYSIGIVMIELLTGDPKIDFPITIQNLKLHLINNNLLLNSYPESLVNSLCDLIFQMLNTSLDNRSINANTVYIISDTIKKQFKHEESAIELRGAKLSKTESTKIEEEHNWSYEPIKKLIQDFENTTKSLSQVTTAMIRTKEELTKINLKNSDSEILENLSNTFKNARNRINLSWNIGIIMTIACFLLIFIMLCIGIILSVNSGNNSFGIIFGGAGIITIIGTILWRPFDKVFKATILAQQLDFIYLQSISSLKTTNDMNEQIKIFRETSKRLQTLLEYQSKD